jgi:hypothetical protein
MEFKNNMQFTAIEEVFAKHLRRQLKRQEQHQEGEPSLQHLAREYGRKTRQQRKRRHQNDRRARYVMRINADNTRDVFDSIQHALDVLGGFGDQSMRMKAYSRIYYAIYHKRIAFGAKWEWSRCP